MATSFGSVRADVFGKEERKQHYGAYVRGLNAFDRHRKFMADYVQFYGKSKCVEGRLPIKTDQDILREAYRFIRSEEDDLDSSWEQRLAKRYHDKLFKEYCIADMSRYKHGKIGLRWRVEKEVISGKGQFICGNSKCDEKEGLSSYEVNFSYKEAGENKQALVKLRVCERCATKLNYKKRKEKAKQLDEEEERRKRLRYDKEDKKGSSTESDNESGTKQNGKDKRKEQELKSATMAICKHKGDLDAGGEFDKYFEKMFL